MRAASTGAILLCLAPVSAQQTAPIKGFEPFQEWARFVWTHKSGEFDESARLTAETPLSELSTIHADLWALVTLLAQGPNAGNSVQYTGVNQAIRPTSMARPQGRPRSISMEQVHDLIGVPAPPGGPVVDKARLREFFKRAALLHTDVAMLAPTLQTSARPPTGTELAATTRKIVDGEDAGWDSRPIHWEIARAALDGVPLSTSDTPLISAWYRATAAYLAFRREYGYLARHLVKARVRLPDDARVQFYSGVLHESHAAPLVQSALASIESRMFRPDVKSAVDELKVAEQFYRRTLELDAGFALARLHLGRVHSLLGQHDLARLGLKRTLAELNEPRQQYFAEMFLGVEEGRAGNISEAKAAYTRAGRLFPEAQAPKLALAQLSLESGDHTGAQETFQKLVLTSSHDDGREDPWWTYEVSSVLDVAVLIEEMRRLAAEHLPK